ncbi:MAG: SPOR domain-containing protein [Gammaproteobacteria bacterium]|nr:SPOR domain-containing protein [Gammaproteobacteria bacterium]
MRTVFLALVFANLLYFGWAHWIATPARLPADSLGRLPRLKLAEELPPEARVPHPTPTAQVAAECVSVGPFGDADNAGKASAVLKARGFEPRQRAQATDTAAGWAVIASGFANQADSDKALVALEREGIRDALVMPATVEAGRRLSLGLFSERSRAEKRAAAARRLGLRAEVSERRLPASVYWLDLAAPSAGAVPLQELPAAGVSGKPGAEPCPVAGEAVAGRTAAAGAPHL